MKKVILIGILQWFTLSATAQISPNAWDSLTYWIEKEIKTAKPDLERRSGRIELKYRKEESDGLLIINKPSYATTDVVMSPLSSLVPTSLYEDQDSLHLRASYQFDEFTDELFFSRWTNVYTIQKIFGGHNTLHVDALGGTGSFRRRWAAYVQKVVPTDTTTRYITMGKIQWLSFDLDLDGNIILAESNTSDTILATFLKGEKPWKPGIHNGIRIRARISLALPERISQLYATHWDSDAHVSPIIEEYAHDLHHKNILVADNMFTPRDGVNMISMLNDHGEVAAVRYHKGNLQACQDIEDQIRNSGIIKEYSAFHLGTLQRIYFYTYME